MMWYIEKKSQWINWKNEDKKIESKFGVEINYEWETDWSKTEHYLKKS